MSIHSYHVPIGRVIRREVDTAVIGAILLAAAYLAMISLAPAMLAHNLLALSWQWLGLAAPLFGAAALFLTWVVAAWLAEVLGLTHLSRHWNRIVVACLYISESAPYVALIECFLSIIGALIAYSAAGATAQAQSAMIAQVAVALAASATGCGIAFVAFSLATLVSHRAGGSLS
jgi:hypothetical protein